MNKKSQIVTFKNSEGQTEIKLKLKSETIWLSQKQVSVLFDKDSYTIGLHLKNIYNFGELVGIQKAQISKIENRTSNARLDTVLRVFKALHTKVKFQVQLLDENLSIA